MWLERENSGRGPREKEVCVWEYNGKSMFETRRVAMLYLRIRKYTRYITITIVVYDVDNAVISINMRRVYARARAHSTTRPLVYVFSTRWLSSVVRFEYRDVAPPIVSDLTARAATTISPIVCNALNT